MSRARETPRKLHPAEYQAWKGMLRRSRSASPEFSPIYKDRGIRVHLRWRLSFEAFLADMGPKPSPRHSIDRIDNDGHYEPSNCCWSSASEQNRNQRRTKLTASIVARFRAAAARGANISEMARLEGLSEATVWCAVSGRSWRDVAVPPVKPVADGLKPRGRGIGPRAATHCKNGHEFTEANTSWIKSRRGDWLQRRCRRCVADNATRYQKRRTRLGLDTAEGGR